MFTSGKTGSKAENEKVARSAVERESLSHKKKEEIRVLLHAGVIVTNEDMGCRGEPGARGDKEVYYSGIEKGTGNHDQGGNRISIWPERF